MDGAVPSPGQLPSHYAPSGAVVLADAGALPRLVADAVDGGLRVAALWPGRPAALARGALSFELPSEPEAAAPVLYAHLRAADAAGAELIFVVLPVERGVGVAIADRLRRAAAPRPLASRHEIPGD
jgi:L-threonylcarbamoyladenylate synthase